MYFEGSGCDLFEGTVPTSTAKPTKWPRSRSDWNLTHRNYTISVTEATGSENQLTLCSYICTYSVKTLLSGQGLSFVILESVNLAL